MRVVSLVPSLTETLLACDVNVVGRTRFCIHPAERVRDIPVVGGTKQVNWDLCEALSPDLVVLDREENTREMADSCPYSWHATHITSIDGVGRELTALANVLSSSPLSQLAGDWLELDDMADLSFRGWQSLPGLIEPVGNPAAGFNSIRYMIWRDPWMTIGQDTFIGSVLKKVGIADFLHHHDKPYPELPGDLLPETDTFYLFSSEPYPFGRYVDELGDSGFNGAIVDGEFFSWFGVRSYKLLRTYMTESVI